MTATYLEYPLAQGYIDNWLMAGPYHVPAEGDVSHSIDCPANLLDPGEDSPDRPAEHAPLTLASETLTWRYIRCLEDHLVDASDGWRPGDRIRAYTYAQLVSSTSHDATLVLSTSCPATLYVNGERALVLDEGQPQTIRSASVDVNLREGANPVLVCLGTSDQATAPCVASLRVQSDQDVDGLGVRLPTLAQRPHRRLTYEEVFDHAYLASNVVYKGDVIDLYWSDALTTRWNVAYSVQDEQGRTYLNGTTEARAYASFNAGHPSRLWERLYYVCLQAHGREYYEEGLRYGRRIPVHVLDTPYSQTPYGTYEERRKEALEHATKREEDPLGEVAKMALERWPDLKANLLCDAITTIKERGENAIVLLLAFLGALYRYGHDDGFPSWLRTEIEDCARDFGCEQAGSSRDGACSSDSQALLTHTVQLLADQEYGEHFSDTAGKTGDPLGVEVEQTVLELLRHQGTRGFYPWDSNAAWADNVVALSHLSDLAESEQIRELAAVVMDKLLFSLALNSYRGAFGSSHGLTSTSMILGAQLEATSGISRLLWGMGVWNPHIQGTVSLACSQYELPPLIGLIAIDQPEELWSQESHACECAGASAQEVNKVTYKTPDYMLSSAQDYSPGQPGAEEHIWQATLGEDAVAFVNHPASMSERDVHRPSFWRGNAILPRVAQWKDTLVAVHVIPEGVLLGFSHAYFPVRAFDQYTFDRGWAFASKDTGYLAIAASNGVELVKRGPTAYRELRSYGTPTVWVCQMGRASLDGSFDDFRRRVLSMPLEWQGSSVHLETLRHQNIEFGWTEPLAVDGEQIPLSGYKHYDSPYCVAEFPVHQMELRWRDASLTLDLS